MAAEENVIAISLVVKEIERSKGKIKFYTERNEKLQKEIEQNNLMITATIKQIAKLEEILKLAKEKKADVPV